MAEAESIEKKKEMEIKDARPVDGRSAQIVYEAKKKKNNQEEKGYT